MTQPNPSEQAIEGNAASSQQPQHILINYGDLFNRIEGNAASSQQPQLLSIDEYIRRFTDRYKSEKQFKNIVHGYLKLTPFKKAALPIYQFVWKSRYNRLTNEI